MQDIDSHLPPYLCLCLCLSLSLPLPLSFLASNHFPVTGSHSLPGISRRWLGILDL